MDEIQTRIKNNITYYVDNLYAKWCNTKCIMTEFVYCCKCNMIYEYDKETKQCCISFYENHYTNCNKRIIACKYHQRDSIYLTYYGYYDKQTVIPSTFTTLTFGNRYDQPTVIPYNDLYHVDID